MAHTAAGAETGGYGLRLAKLRRECEELLAGIEIPRPFHLETFCDYVAGRRGRALHLHVLPTPAAAGVPCGMWLATAEADHVFHARGSSPLHQLHIVLHEIGHMLCDHTLPAAARGGPWSQLLPDLDPRVVERVLLRSGYSAPQEQVAEMVATLILAHAGDAPRRPDDGAGLGTLREAFGHPAVDAP